MEFESLLELGTVIRLNRESQNLSLSVLAEDSRVSVSQLSKIERKLETSNKEVYTRIFEALGIEYELLVQKKEHYEKWFDKIFNMIIHLERDELVIQEINNYCNEQETSFLVCEYVLIKLIKNRIYTFNQKECVEIINLLSKMENNLTFKQKQIFYTYLAIYYQDCGNIDGAVAYFELALSLYPSPEIKAMIGYYIAPIYRKKRQILKAHRYLLSSKEYFLYSGNYSRSLLTDLVIAGLYASNREYKEALALYYKCIHEFSRFDIDIYSKASAYINVLYIHILKEDFQEGKRVLDSIPDDILQFMNKKRIKHFFLYKAIIYYGVNLDDEAYYICKSFKEDYDKNNFIDNYLMYYCYLNKTKNDRIKFLKRIKSLIYKNKDLSEVQFYFKLLNRESISEKDDEELKEIFLDYFSEKI